MEENNFDLKGFLNDPKAQADKAGAVRYLQQKGIIDTQGNMIDKSIQPAQPIQPTEFQKQAFPQPPGAEAFGQAGIGFGKEVLKRASTFGSIAPTIGAKIGEIFTGKKQPVFSPIPERLTTPEGTAQKVGAGIEKVAEFIAPGGLIKTGTGAVRTALGSKVSANMVKWLTAGAGAGLEALSAGVISKIQGATNKDARNNAILAGALSLPFKAISEFKAPIGRAIQTTAEKKASQALGATTKEMKQISDKIVPELLKRKTFFLTRGGLEKKAGMKADIFGDKIDEAWDMIPPESKIQISPIINSLEKLKDSAVTVGRGGQRVVIDNEKYKAVQFIQNKFLQLARDPEKFVSYPDVSSGSLRKARQILDSATQKTGKGFGLGIKDTSLQEARKTGANAIREELAQEFPNIAKINKEFSFWKNVEKVVGATVERTKAQGTPLGETIAEIGGGVAGFAKGGKLFDTALGVIGAKLLKKAITSPAWRMTSAITRQSIADFIYSGQIDKAIPIIRGIIGGTQLSNQ